MRYIFSCVFVVGLSLQTFSNDTLRFINGLTLGAHLNYGIIYPHHAAIQYLVEERITGFDICLTTQSYGRTIFDKLYRYPRFGMGFLHTTLGNDDVFGKANALYLFMDFTTLGQKNKLNFNYAINFGLGWLNKAFDPENNLMNIAISSPVNFFGALDLKLNYRFNDRNEANAGFKFFHFSNGKIGTPNLGLNSFVLSVGYNYRLIPCRYDRKEPIQPISYNKNEYEIALSAGAKADDQITNQYYFVSSLVFDYKYFPKYRYGFGAGIDLFYDQSLGPNKKSDLGEEYSSSDLYQAGIHAGIYSRYSKLTIMFQIGDYLYATYCKHASFYSRIGFRYKLSDHFLFNFTLKSHYAIADFVEWGIVYRF